MSYGHRRFLSSIAKTVALPKTQPFPPKESRARDSRKTFDPEVWAARQPPPPTALRAFAHRVGLADSLTDPVVIQQICIHPSFIPFHQKHYPDEPVPPSNEVLASLGNSLLGLFASEFIHTTYPHLPTRVLKAVVSAYVGPMTCASVAQEMGASHLLRWDRTPRDPTQTSILRADALSSIPRALTGLIYQQKSLPSSRKFAHDFFLTRSVDIKSLIRFRDPKVALVETVAKFGRERPISRLLKETGRLSNSPVFVVGVFSGVDKLGEGFGSSLKMAEYRAAEDALHRLYLTRHPTDSVNLPTATFPHTSLYDSRTPSLSYIPSSIGESEVNYGFSGRGNSAVGGVGYQRTPGGPVISQESN